MYYTIYTFSYTANPNIIYYYWEPNDLQKMAEIKHILNYYSELNTIYFSCDVVEFSKEIMEELELLMGVKDHMVGRDDYEAIIPMLEKAVKTCVLPTIEIPINTVLGYTTFLNQQWYFPWFNGKALTCNKLTTSLTPPSMLLEWYERQMAKKNVPYKELWERCAALIKKDIPVVEVVVEPIEQIEPQKEVKEVGNSIENIDLYLQLFLEPTEKSELLLSKLYNDYKKKMEECNFPIVTQNAFIKQIRTHSEFTIVRHASGMVITNYGFVTPREIYYFSAKYDICRDRYDKNDIKIMEEIKLIDEAFQQSSQELYHREAYFLLRMTTKIQPTYPVITWFISNAVTHPLLEACKLYLDPYEKIKIRKKHLLPNETAYAFFIMDALNRENTFNHQQFFYPFSSDCLIENIKIKHPWNCETYIKMSSGHVLLHKGSLNAMERVFQPLLPTAKMINEVEGFDKYQDSFTVI